MRKVFHEGVVRHPITKRERMFTVFDNQDGTLDYELTQGIYTTVDISDFNIMIPHIWRAQYDKSILSYYALTNIEKTQVISLHRMIAGVVGCDISVDHKDRNPLNNTRSNLRLATSLQQCLNQTKKRTKVTSQYFGVTKRPDSKVSPFRVRGQNRLGEQQNLGSYKNEIEAAEAWDDFMYNEYVNHNPLSHLTEYNVQGEPTLNFISFNFPSRLGL